MFTVVLTIAQNMLNGVDLCNPRNVILPGSRPFMISSANIVSRFVFSSWAVTFVSLTSFSAISRKSKILCCIDVSEGAFITLITS